MKLYRFSPITTQHDLIQAIQYIHEACYALCRQSFGQDLPNAGNVGVFCHYDEEYAALTAVRNQLVEPSEDPNQKYFRLLEPITFAATKKAPESTYTHLYIRKPDIYRAQVGDVDFYLPEEEYQALKSRLVSQGIQNGMRIFPRQDLDMVELYNYDIDALAYVSPKTMTEKVRIKLSNETNL